MRDLFEAIITIMMPIIIIMAIIIGLAIVSIVSMQNLLHPSKTDEQVQCETVEGAVWGQHACFKDGIKLNFAEEQK